MPPLPSSELECLFDPLLVQPQLLCNPLWTPVNGLEPFLRYRIRKMVYLLTAAVCDEGGLETPMPRISESSLALVRSYLRYVLVVLVSGGIFANYFLHRLSSSSLLSVSLQRTVGQRTFAEQISAIYDCDLSQQLPATAFNFPPRGASMINILVKITNRVKLPDPADQAVLVLMLQMLCVVAYTWARNQQSETEWSPYSAQTGLFCDASISVDDYFGEVDSAVVAVGFLPEGAAMTVSHRYAVREEFRNLDFRTTKCHLEPMAQYFCYIQANFCWTVAAHSSQDMTVMQQVIADYLVHVAHLADTLVRSSRSDPTHGDESAAGFRFQG
ncbi:hypothetical protein C8J57DRAFT_1500420 [Mycena rebaudengoi]|nr:hypothetical protein C8J57DRAFT_1500420 [Mycena rebaudengoi]